MLTEQNKGYQSAAFFSFLVIYDIINKRKIGKL